MAQTQPGQRASSASLLKLGICAAARPKFCLWGDLGSAEVLLKSLAFTVTRKGVLEKAWHGLLITLVLFS